MTAGEATIAAVATPPGSAAIAVLRISGPQAMRIVDARFEPAHGGRWHPGRMRRGWVLDTDGERLDEALAVAFFAPDSYSGEDVVELHCHGGAGVVTSCLSAVLRSGARLAQPGEFTRRAFANGRLDLAQAEAVADLINAESRQAARAAAARLSGAAGKAIGEMRAALLERLVEIEAHIDYPDEVPPPDDGALARSVRAVRSRIGALLAGAGSAKALRDGIDCVIAGPPNAGKSSLLNALVAAERAIVSDIPGTTRDIVEDRLAVDGVTLRLRDTAGLRAATEPIEAEGIARAKDAIAEAELVLLVLDGSRPLGDDERLAVALTAGRPRIVLANKLDLGDAGIAELRRDFAEACRDGAAAAFVAGSVLHGAADGVRNAIARIGWGGGVVDANAALIGSVRQIEALARADEALDHAQATFAARHPIDLVSGDLTAAIAALGEITGETVTEEVLDGIFSRFCVGK